MKTELFTVAKHKVWIKPSFSSEYSYVREIWIGVREKSGKCQGILFCPVCMNPVIYNFIHLQWFYLLILDYSMDEYFRIIPHFRILTICHFWNNELSFPGSDLFSDYLKTIDRLNISNCWHTASFKILISKSPGFLDFWTSPMMLFLMESFLKTWAVQCLITWGQGQIMYCLVNASSPEPLDIRTSKFSGA